MPRQPEAKPRKQRLKGAVSPKRPSTISAAVSIPEALYLSALNAAQSEFEGNFSRYVRTLIKRDLSAA